MTPIPLPEPWNTVFQLVIGPVGAFVAMGLIIYFQWKLFREEQKENRENFQTVTIQSKAIEALTAELKAWREAVMEQKRESP